MARTAAVAPAQLRQQVQAFLPGVALPFDFAQLSLIACSVFVVVSLLQAACGVAMLTRRSYALAVFGAGLSIVNCNQICCFVGIPVGIWSMIVLFRSDVRASFR